MACVRDILIRLESWAPPAVAWEKDNVGLQLGDPAARVSGVLVTLDVTPDVVDEAEGLGANMIVAHHPVIYRPVRHIRADEEQGSLLTTILRRGLHLAVAHTNADAARGGLNQVLAERLGLDTIEPLDVQDGGMTTVVIRLRETGGAMRRVEEYLRAAGVSESFSLRTEEGLFCVEATAPPWLATEICNGMRSAAGDAFAGMDERPSLSTPPGYGMGAVGNLADAAHPEALIALLKERLGAERVRTNGTRKKNCRRVAVCGGSGHTLIPRALAARADVFVTADLSYHDFFLDPERMLLVDAGHYETERVFIDACARAIAGPRVAGEEDVPVHASRIRTNPVRFF